MKIDMSGDQPTIDARDLGQLLDLPPDEVQNLMRAGEITSRFETGEDEDAGKVRLTFFHRGRRVRLTCSKDGTVLSTTRVTTERP
ncbi:hypothetical protein C8N43_3515 [Litoreibacter ponti]|uniref:Uncharacterized protein n=1 Tax=Litoreibacter ponti TaxID=1510457 RepID=A0A2T6BF66_9RHOB|nr:DUF6522 family protein [Litoreibacter ponti]PTX54697.1 hypothetical protein C8N43_3515 [Litoreibacter ponti]